MGFNIAIDGPAGAGKSSIAKLAAKELNFVYVDTGALYRTIGLYMLRNGVDPADEEAAARSLEEIDVRMAYGEDGEQKLFLGEENVTSLIRTEEVSQAASVWSAKPAVRRKLLDLQRTIAAKNHVIMDGRDIGTVILPQAQLKIFLTASPRVRAERRCRQLLERGEEADLAAIEEEIRVRDERDMNREICPLRPAEDAVVLDTSDMTVEQVLERVKELAVLHGWREDFDRS